MKNPPCWAVRSSTANGAGRRYQACWIRRAGSEPEVIALAQSIVDIDELLRNEATGFSLEPLYAKFRTAAWLRRVDLRPQQPPFIPADRAILYRSPYYDESRQSLMLVA